MKKSSFGLEGKQEDVKGMKNTLISRKYSLNGLY